MTCRPVIKGGCAQDPERYWIWFHNSSSSSSSEVVVVVVGGCFERHDRACLVAQIQPVRLISRQDPERRRRREEEEGSTQASCDEQEGFWGERDRAGFFFFVAHAVLGKVKGARSQ